MNGKIDDDSEINIYPSKWMIDCYEAGVPIEAVKKKIQDEYADSFTAHVACYIAEEFYKQWDKGE